MSEVVLENVTKKFGKLTVLDGVNLKINAREFFVLLGPSGSGKTTLLRLIAGLEEITSGSIYIGGRKVNDLPPKERNIAMVFQNYALYPHMTVYDNIALPLKIKNYGEEKIKEKIKTIAETLHIEDILQKKPSQISGGQQQRVALARALVRDPAVFLLDEPLSNLDAKLRVEARAFLKSLQKEVGITTVFVTHDQSEAMALATTIAVLNKGVIKQVGDPYELYTKPMDIFTAGFIGSPAMNMIPGKLIKEGSSWKFLSDDFSLDLSGIKFDNETETILGIRPEHIVIANDQGLNAKIKNVEPMGAVTYLEIKVGNTELTAQYTGLVKLEAGMDVKIRFVEDKMLFYDKKTEKLINY
ncbi:MAG: ABC transporter ATP-binding protein [Conexivisphaerales archaeon]|jgi:multiple sugar transport system ATP-binding protein|nr:ABC transporter ATP-binding protein [Conexivisphaerales archaeon]